MAKLATTLALLILATAVLADDVYQTPSAFLADSFDGDVPDPQLLWITKDLREAIRDDVGHEPRALRVRYWYREGRSAWILEETGKERPMTTGVVVDAGRIERLKVLIYRESRGWEVRYPFFTDQFKGAMLSQGADRLDRPIDNISGATLSVRALKTIARLALYLHGRIEDDR